MATWEHALLVRANRERFGEGVCACVCGCMPAHVHSVTLHRGSHWPLPTRPTSQPCTATQDAALSLTSSMVGNTAKAAASAKAAPCKKAAGDSFTQETAKP